MTVNTNNPALSVVGFSQTPEVADGAAASGPLQYQRAFLGSEETGVWASSADPFFPLVAVTKVRTEAPTPTFFTAVPDYDNRWTFSTGFNSSDLLGTAANGSVYFPPVRLPVNSGLATADALTLGCSFGGTTMAVNIGADNLWYQTNSTAFQPRLSIDINAAGTGATITGEAFQVYQDSEGFPLQSIVDPAPRDPGLGRTTISTSANMSVFMHMANGFSNAWTYDPYFGRSREFDAGTGSTLRIYNDTEGGRWGWNFGPAMVVNQIVDFGGDFIRGSKVQGYLGWPTGAETIIRFTDANYTPGPSTAVMTVGAPLSQAHRASHSIAWGTGVLGTGYDPSSLQLPYAPRAKNSVTAYNAAGTGWTATNDTICEPMFRMVDYSATTTGTAVLLVPHYIDRASVYANVASDDDYEVHTPASVLNATATIVDAKINVIPANLPTGNVSNRTEGQTWANNVAALIADPLVKTVATSALHIALAGLGSNKQVVIMKFGDSVLGQGVKFKDVIETYTSATSFSYTEPNTYVISPSALPPLTVSDFNTHEFYTGEYPSASDTRGCYGYPYQGFMGYCRYLLSFT
jgi:hypothetical protein